MTADPAKKSGEVPAYVLPLALIGGFAILLDAFAFVLGDTIDLLPFLAMTTVVAAAAIGAVFSPRWVAHGLAIVLGAASLAASIAAFMKGLTPVLPCTLAITGGLLGALGFQSLRDRRAAWSFLIAMTGVLFVVTFFGAPKVRATLGVGIWTALWFPGLFAVATIGLGVLHERYRPRS